MRHGEDRLAALIAQAFQCLLVRLRRKRMKRPATRIQYFQCLLVRLRLLELHSAIVLFLAFNACWCD